MNVFYNLQIEEILKGESPDEIPVKTYEIPNGFTDAPKYMAGERLLLFLHEDGGKWHSAKSFETYYYAVSMDNGIFDMEGEIAHPRVTYMFLNDEELVIDGGEAYFHIDKLRASIEEYKGDQLNTN